MVFICKRLKNIKRCIYYCFPNLQHYINKQNNILFIYLLHPFTTLSSVCSIYKSQQDISTWSLLLSRQHPTRLNSEIDGNLLQSPWEGQWQHALAMFACNSFHSIFLAHLAASACNCCLQRLFVQLHLICRFWGHQLSVSFFIQFSFSSSNQLDCQLLPIDH